MAELVEEDPMPRDVEAAVMPATTHMARDQNIAEREITIALEKAAEQGEEIILSGLYGAPTSADGFTVREYINLDAPTVSPIEAYPQEPGNRFKYLDAVYSYISANYELAKKELQTRFQLMGPDEIKTLATKPEKLERLIHMMQLRRYTPVPKVLSRCDGKYLISEKDPVLYMADGMDYTSLLQVTIQPDRNIDGFIEEFNTLKNAFSPEQRLQLGEIKQVMPNLTEQPVNDGGETKVLRVRVESSFSLNAFMGFTTDESTLREEWFKFIAKWTYDFKIIASRPVHFKPIALFPGVLPEHGIDEIKEVILEMGSVRESPQQIAMDWTKECSCQTMDAAITVLFTETESSLMKIITETPLSLSYGRVQGIGIHEIGSSFHAEVLSRHNSRMAFQQILEIRNVPSWSSIDTTMHPPTAPNREDHSDLTIAQYFKRFQPDGTIGDYDTSVFQDVTVGNVPTAIVMTTSQESLGAVESKMEEICMLFQETIGPVTDISIRLWPEVDMTLLNQEAPENSTQGDNVPVEQHQDDAPPMEDEEQRETAPADSQIQGNEVNNLGSENPQTSVREDLQEIKQHLLRLTKAVESKESLTAPLTTITASSNGEVSPMSTASLADALYMALERAYRENGFLTAAESSKNEANQTSSASLADAMYVALERAHKEEGFLYHSARADSEAMVQVLKDALDCTTPVVQESVRESIEEGSVHLQQTVQESIQDTTTALLRMITNPSKEHAGEIAMITKDHLAPYFETMTKAMTRIATVAEISSHSPENAAMGDAQSGIASAYTLLQDIKQTMRLILFQISRGQDVLNRAVLDVETSLAREQRKDTENRIKIQHHSRRMLQIKNSMLQNVKASPEAERLKPMADLIEESLGLQLSFQEQVDKMFRMGEQELRNESGYSSSENNQEDGHNSDDSIEEEEEGSATPRKSPPEDQIIDAQCELATVAEEEDEESAVADVEAAEIELALKMSMQDQNTKPSALSEIELAEKKAAEEGEKAQERLIRQMEKAQIDQDIAPFLSTPPPSPTAKAGAVAEDHDGQSDSPKVDKNSVTDEIAEVPGTPIQIVAPKVVTPKELKLEVQEDEMERLITGVQQEVSNLTIPTTLAGPNADATEESETETVLSGNCSPKKDKTPMPRQIDQESIASRTRGSKNSQQ
jgi:hypothetical protein